MIGAILKVVVQAAKGAARAAANAAKSVAKKAGKNIVNKWKNLNPFRTPAGPKRTLKERFLNSQRRQAADRRAQSAIFSDEGAAKIPYELSKPLGDILVPDQQKSLGSSGFQGTTDSQYNEPTFKYPSPKLSPSYLSPRPAATATTPSDSLLKLASPTSPMSGGTSPTGAAPSPTSGGINALNSSHDGQNGGINTLQKVGSSEGGYSPYSTPTHTAPVFLSGVNVPFKTVSGEAPPLLRPQTTASPATTYVAPTQSSSPSPAYSNTTPQPDSKQRSLDIRSHTGFKHGK